MADATQTGTIAGGAWSSGAEIVRGQTSVSDFSAAPSALGYVYQFEIALLGYLGRDDPGLAVSIELLDDVAFEGEQTELLQSKLEITPGSLTDASTNLWKTLRVWAESDSAKPPSVLVLMTTGHAPEGSIAALLRDDGLRDPARAHDRLLSTASASTNQQLAPAMQAFRSMDEQRRRDMVTRIVIADDAPVIEDLDAAYETLLRHAAPQARLKQLISRLREWWLLRCEQHLASLALGIGVPIAGEEIEMKIADLRDQLTQENLPSDLQDLAAPTSEEAEEDQRKFVMQLRLIALANQRVALAIHDHNRAFAQRARWVREDLLVPGELSNYDRTLKEEWERLFLPYSEDEATSTEEAAKAHGREVHRACEAASVEPIRPKVTEAYVMRGSLQMLADELKIGWHPDWIARVHALLSQATP